MVKPAISRIALATAVFGFGVASALAQSAPNETPPHSIYYADPGAPDIAGFWRPEFRPTQFDWLVDGKPAQRNAGQRVVGLPFTPAWKKAYEARLASNLAGKPYGDPHYNCWPRGPVSEYTSGNATMSIVQTPGRMTQTFQEDMQVRYFYTDGRKMTAKANPTSDDYEPKMNGYSIGHWEGNVFVGETRGIRKELTLGIQVPHSDVTVVTERLWKSDPTHLKVDLRVDDAKMLTKPIETHFSYVLDPKGDFEDDFCAEGNVNFTDKDGYVQTIIEYRRPTTWDLPDD